MLPGSFRSVPQQFRSWSRKVNLLCAAGDREVEGVNQTPFHHTRSASESESKMVFSQFSLAISPLVHTLALASFIVTFTHAFVCNSGTCYREGAFRCTRRMRRPTPTPTPLYDQLPQQQGYGELFEMGYSGEGICLPQPTSELSAEDIVDTCMDSLMTNDDPRANAGLEVCFNFSSDRCRASLGGSLEKFIEFASNPIFASMVNAKEWTKVKVGPIITGSQTRGAMQTVLVDLKPESGRDRRFLWTLQQERRPPRQGCWLVHECIFVENAFALTE